LNNSNGGAGCWWITPVSLATQEDIGSKPTQTNSSQTPLSKTRIIHTHIKKKKKGAGAVALPGGPEFKPGKKKAGHGDTLL
jgi:hypothetical protein